MLMLIIFDVIVQKDKVMYNFYCDESGNTGSNWADQSQPYLIYGGWLVEKEREFKIIAEVCSVLIDMQSSEIKSSKFLESRGGLDKFKKIFKIMLDNRCIPFYVVAEKQYLIAGKLIESYLDPEYNPHLNSMLPWDKDLRRDLAHVLMHCQPAITKFSKEIRSGEINIPELEDIRNDIVTFLRGYSCDNLVSAFNTMKAGELQSIILDFECKDENLGSENIYVIITKEEHKMADIALEQPRFSFFQKCLEDIGIKDSYRVTSLLNRNISCFKRKYAKSEIVRTPKWASKHNRNEIIPVALLTGFNVGVEGDRGVVAELSGKTCETYVETLDRWLNVDDSPITKDNSIYSINSKEELLSVLGITYQNEKVKALENILCRVFGVADPHYAKNPKFWHIKDTKSKYTGLIVRGMLDTFAILANDDKARNDFYTLVKKILDAAKSDVQLLFTVLEYFPLLSEISASAVLEFIENAVDTDDKIFRKILEQTYGTFFETSHAVHINWTLQSCVRREDCCAQALRIYLKLFYSQYNVSKSVGFDRLGEVFAPFSSGVIAMSAKDN